MCDVTYELLHRTVPNLVGARRVGDRYQLRVPFHKFRTSNSR